MFQISKSSSENGNKSDSNKSDDDFVTASECTGTPPSRASSFHTASEGESASPWWDMDTSSSPENEVGSSKYKVIPEPEKATAVSLSKLFQFLIGNSNRLKNVGRKVYQEFKKKKIIAMIPFS